LKIQLSKGEGWNSTNQFNPVTFCACPNPGPGFPTPYVMGVFVFNDLMREVHFADIGGILIDKGAVVIVW
jgi:hypothetical protein